jgi:predicted phage terminase large subunit-like protein
MANAQQTELKKTALTARLIEAFAINYLYKGFDEPKPTPQFHRDGWELYASDTPQACVIAPRGHAKSSALTHVFILASVLFRDESYVILVSTNEELAIEHLGDITRELIENEELINDFEIKGFITNSKTEIIVEFKDGHQFRILARGSGQKMRGRKWRGMRPGLIVCDDLEDDEQVENKDRRDKFRRWFNRAVLPALRRGGKARVHGTILHEDSLLSRFKKQPKGWKVRFYRAHKSFDDFTEILWPEQFDEQGLRDIRQRYIDDFDAPGYSQEYLNDPYDNTETYLKKDQFAEMQDEHFDLPMRVCVGVDFAISKAEKANRTSFTTAGQDADNFLNFFHQWVGRWDINEIIANMIALQERFDAEHFFVEDGVIWKAIEPVLNQEMAERNVFLHCVAISSVKDKATRGRSFQRRMKAGRCRFDKQAEWYAPYEHECLRFTGYSEAVLDDQFDSSAILSRGFDTLPLLDETDFMSEEELYARDTGPRQDQGRSTTTGY